MAELVSPSSELEPKSHQTLDVLSEAAQTRFSWLVALMEMSRLVIVGLLAWKAAASSLTQSSRFADCHPA
jgi:cytoskeletal protein RodZ